MNKTQALEYLRNNPVFWSRLGFCYDPPIADEKGNPLVFQPDFSRQLKIHDDFSDAGVKIHTCILHSGWVGVRKYDYSLCDKVLNGIFASGKTEYFIPRIKLNVPVDWCYENPEEILVYENGPRLAEDIKKLVGTEKHDWLGYDSLVGYYNAGAWKDTRPNVGGLISLQSFSSKKWLNDAGEALKRLVIHLENSPYADKILAYHIAYGACGESMLWGRQNGKFGDYGISNRKHFHKWALEKYGSEKELEKAWGAFGEDIVPPSHLREKTPGSSNGFYKDDLTDRWSIDYDLFTSEINVRALEHFGKIVKENTKDKPVGAFYGYVMMMERTAYSGHLGWEKLLSSQYVDFFAAPKSYIRCCPGEPGGEMAPALSVNRQRLWVDECDNRTHLTVGDNHQNASTPEETYAVQLRELCKNISHNSGLWYMDLGGGWYDDSGIMNNISHLMKASEKIRLSEHKSCAEIVVIVDEKSIMKTYPNVTRKTEDFLRELQLCGAPIDIIFSFDTNCHDFSKAKLAVILTPLYMNEEKRAFLKERLPDNCKIAFCGKTEGDFGFKLCETKSPDAPTYAICSKDVLPIIEKDGICICAESKNGDIEISDIVKMRVEDIKALLSHTDIICPAPAECAVYEDSRIVSFFPRESMTFVPDIPKGKYRDFMTGEPYIWGTPLKINAKSGLALIKE